jgi:hypothetical protein
MDIHVQHHAGGYFELYELFDHHSSWDAGDDVQMSVGHPVAEQC